MLLQIPTLRGTKLPLYICPESGEQDVVRNEADLRTKLHDSNAMWAHPDGHPATPVNFSDMLPGEVYGAVLKLVRPSFSY